MIYWSPVYPLSYLPPLLLKIVVVTFDFVVSTFNFAKLNTTYIFLSLYLQND